MIAATPDRHPPAVMTAAPALSIVIPAYNEASRLGPTLRGAFVELGTGYALGRIDYDATGLALPHDLEHYLLGHIGFGVTLRGQSAPGSELYVDGRLATRTGDSRVETVVPECGGSTTEGLSGNDQPWVLGFDTSRSGDMLDGLVSHFSGGAMDALQISAVRRDFASP